MELGRSSTLGLPRIGLAASCSFPLFLYAYVLKSVWRPSATNTITRPGSGATLDGDWRSLPSRDPETCGRGSSAAKPGSDHGEHGKGAYRLDSRQGTAVKTGDTGAGREGTAKRDEAHPLTATNL
ncbi:hypothetical protein E2C01_039013 [Portunus trituberculatus]|uniref:Uncharacterized protein n=1 Tax=Portunus trituberculatus TaxID=210409 RepID=A0A5B7FIF6_PORTR|nr:hypothetical protein [Portunus trituberculatus]